MSIEHNSSFEKIEAESGQQEEMAESNLTKEFWERHQDYGKELKERYDYSEEMCVRNFLLKDVRQVFADLGFEETEEIHYQDKDNKKSDVIFNIDTFTEGRFETRLLTGKEPEIVIKAISDYDTKSLKKAFDLLKERGVFLSPIFIAGKDEKYPFPESPDTPPKLSPSAREITDEEWRKINEQSALSKSSMAGYSKEVQEELSKRFWDWPRVGANGLRTKYGMVNGTMLYCDGVIAVFETPHGKIEIPFSELLDPFGDPYGEREKKKGTTKKSKETLETKYLGR